MKPVPILMMEKSVSEWKGTQLPVEQLVMFDTVLKALAYELPS